MTMIRRPRRRPSAGWASVGACVVALWGWSLAVHAAGDPHRGKAVYEKNCLGCHGKTGAGLGGATPNLADAATMTANTDRELFDTVTNGRPGTGMPAWGKILNESDRWSVIAYIRTLSAP